MAQRHFRIVNIRYLWAITLVGTYPVLTLAGKPKKNGETFEVLDAAWIMRAKKVEPAVHALRAFAKANGPGTFELIAENPTLWQCLDETGGRGSLKETPLPYMPEPGVKWTHEQEACMLSYLAEDDDNVPKDCVHTWFPVEPLVLAGYEANWHALQEAP